MNHELLKSVIFDQHAAIQAARQRRAGWQLFTLSR